MHRGGNGRGRRAFAVRAAIAAVLLAGAAACSAGGSGAGAPGAGGTGVGGTALGASSADSVAPGSVAPGSGVPGPAAPSAAPAPTASADPGPAGAAVEKLLVFVVENHSLAQMTAQMPYLHGLATQYGYADHYTAVAHPSLPNYLAIAGGDTFGVQDDNPPSAHPLAGHSVFGAAAAAGRTAKLYADAMSTPCQLNTAGTYAVKHNPWAYFVDEAQDCQRYDAPLDQLSADINGAKLPVAGMVVPDLCNDAHDCPLAQADGWLRTWVGAVLAGPDWRSGQLAVVITADEDDDHSGNQVLTVVAHPSLRAAVVSAPLNHYSLTRAYTDVAGVPPLRRGASAGSLLASFGLAVG
ncbi:MAG: alkaline phosphatase family protein [Frankiaceae bacterium]|jgi:acid phosphatase|nr:alkaline phosphatase family protein [Frankiaceae bacterium]